MRALLIESDPGSISAVETILLRECFKIYATGSGEEGLELARRYEYDIILLDLALPDMHGLDVLQRLRSSRIATPVLIVSGLSDTGNKVRSFASGADDYVTTPFQHEELIARIHAIIRRSQGHSQSMIRTGKLAVNLYTQTAEVGGRRIHVTASEYAILELLSLRRGSTLTKDMILNHLYGGMDEPDAKIIDVFICKLRKKLILAGADDVCIETVWGRGYVLREADGATIRMAAG